MPNNKCTMPSAVQSGDHSRKSDLAFRDWGPLEHELYYQTLVNETKPSATIMTDFGGRILHSSGALFDEIGISCEDIQRTGIEAILQFVYEPDRQAVIDKAAAVRTERLSCFEQEFRIVKHDGTLMWIFQTGKQTFDIDGEPLFISVFVDATSRREMHELLRMSASEMSVAMEQSGNMLMIYDVVAGELAISRQYCRKHAIPEKIYNVPAGIDELGILLPSDIQRLKDQICRIQSGEPRGGIELRVRAASGDYCYERIDYSSIFDSNGRPARAIISVTDTSELHEKAAENAMLRRNALAMRMVASHSDRIVWRYDLSEDVVITDAETAKKNGIR